MSGISYKDLVYDLAHVLKTFIEPMQLKFFFSDSELSLDEVFMKSGCMPLFLYDKQSFINYNIRHKKIGKFDTEPFAKLNFQEDSDSYFNLKIEIVHNLYNNDYYNIENSVYETLLYSLAEKILSEPGFVIQGNKVFLDNKYQIFMNEFQNGFIQKIPELERLKGETA